MSRTADLASAGTLARFTAVRFTPKTGRWSSRWNQMPAIGQGPTRNLLLLTVVITVRQATVRQATVRQVIVAAIHRIRQGTATVGTIR